MDALRQAIEDALENGDFIDEEMRDQIEQLRMEGKLGERDRRVDAAHAGRRIHLR